MNNKYSKHIRVRYLGKSNPLALLTGKVYEALIGQFGVYCIVDETGEEYAYDPKFFEIVDEKNENDHI